MRGLTKFVSGLTRKEGKKVSVSNGNMHEIIGLIADEIADKPLETIAFLCKYAAQRKKKGKKK